MQTFTRTHYRAVVLYASRFPHAPCSFHNSLLMFGDPKQTDVDQMIAAANAAIDRSGAVSTDVMNCECAMRIA